MVSGCGGLVGDIAMVAEWGHGGMAGSRLIVVRVGDVEVEVEAVAASGTEATSGRAAKAAASALDAFNRAQDAIVEVAKSTAVMIERAGAAARPDRVEVEFGLKFSASGGVIMAGVAGEATLKVTLGYDVAARPAGKPAAALAESAPDVGGTSGLRSDSTREERAGAPAEAS